eukprot:maker-scaffold997_size72291-snap-gene-0.1 protein:Tk11184 transcript:maker-scaffold997_size72291-snap-gene-0.1-mRNA-1 annotation:"heat shock protein 90"
MFQDLSDPNKEYGPKLYVQNVLILENAKDLLPVWLRFISGVVETSDLPLNISREMLQSNTTLDSIKSESVAALKTGANGVDPQMEKMMKAMGQAVAPQKRVLELNPNHQLIQAMKKEFNSDITSKKLQDLMKYSYNSAVLLE